VLPRGLGGRLERALGLRFLRAAVLPVLAEEALDQRGDLRHAFLVELAREEHRDILDHAAALRLVDRPRRRPDEQQARLLLAVRVVQGQLDLDRLVAQRPQVLERGLEGRVEAAAGLAGPAQEQQEVLLVEAQAGFVLLQALHVGEAVGVEIVQQGRERLLDLLGLHRGPAALG